MSDWTPQFSHSKSAAQSSPTRRKEKVAIVSDYDIPKSSSVVAGLSSDARDTLLQLKLKKGKQDPFDPELQEVFDDFIDSIPNLTSNSIDLSETGLLLARATDIFTSQVVRLYDDIKNLAALVTNTKPEEKPHRGRRKLQENKPEDEIKSDETKSNDPINLSEENKSSVDVSTDGKPDEGLRTEAGGQDKDEEQLLGEKVENGENVEKKQENEEEKKLDENGLPLPDQGSSQVSVEESGSKPPPESDVYGPLKAGETQCLIIPNKKRRMLNSEGNQEKKSRYGPPPDLISCFDEERELMEQGHFDCISDEPPLLSIVPPREKRKYCRKIPTENSPEKTNLDSVPPSEMLPSASDLDLSFPSISSDSSSVSKISETDSGYGSNGSNDSSLSSTSDSDESMLQTLSRVEFSSEDHAIIQECINGLHYLPFTFELSKSDISIAFEKTVDRLCDVFQKNNVPLNREVVRAASAFCKSLASDSKSPNVSTEESSVSVKTFYESVMENCIAQNVDLQIENSLHKKKSDGSPNRESMKSLISDLQRSIISRYITIPLRVENTPEFFMRVKNFEKKMKKILEAEAKKQEFDVKKYEMEVLEATSREVALSEGDDDSKFLSPNDVSVSSMSSPLRPEHRLSCSSTSSEMNRWVPLSRIFNTAKNMEKVEACRTFYAVLALLSYQNLDIDYDQLYSAESAAIAKKASGNVTMDMSSNRGVKIMTSRCPNIDKEEIYIAALTSTSRTVEFRNLFSKDKNGATSSAESYHSNTNVEVLNGVDSSWQEEAGEDYVVNALGRRRKSKIMKKE